VPTAAFASVAAGSEVTFQWDQWGSSHSGPVMTCAQSCPALFCSGAGLIVSRIDIAKCTNGCANFKGDSGECGGVVGLDVG
jgi:cellulase